MACNLKDLVCGTFAETKFFLSFNDNFLKITTTDTHSRMFRASNIIFCQNLTDTFQKWQPNNCRSDLGGADIIEC